MTSKKILLISLNSPFELTGGGIYLRTLIDVFSSQGDLTLIAKKNNQKNDIKINNKVAFFGVKKNLFVDVFSRFFLQPTFLFFYIFKILKSSSNHDVIVFHNSRNGIVLSIVSVILRKEIICCFDNVEYNVLSSSKANSLPKKLMNFIDMMVIRFVERNAYIQSCACTFITDNDKIYFEKKYGLKSVSSLVIPVSVPPQKDIKASNEFFIKCNPDKKVLLFTASFDFPPNQKALDDLLSLSDKLSSAYVLVVAGRSLDKFNEYLVGRETRVFFYSDPSATDMCSIFRLASLYISPVSTGSGMKTKIAEALSFGLPVIASCHSLIGYEKIESNQVIMKYENTEDLLHLLDIFENENQKGILFYRQEALKCFNEYYSPRAVNSIINKSNWFFFRVGEVE